jgi:hypothetical protein
MTAPNITVSPLIFDETLHPEEYLTTYLSLLNTGDGPLNWTAFVVYPATSAPASSSVFDENFVPAVETAERGGQINVVPEGTRSLSSNRALLFDNGPIVNSPGTGAGGADESVLQNVSLGMNTLGGGFQQVYGNSIADDFEVTATWTVDGFTFYGYQTNAGNTSTITGAYFQIYDGDPTSGGTVIWGDLSTNRMTSTQWTNIYRVTETTGGTTDRAIKEVYCATTGLTLDPGTYWVEVQLTGSASSGPWCPPVTINGQATTGNAVQYTGSWGAWLDGGTYTGQGMPFLIEGSGGGGAGGWLTLDDNVGIVAPGGGSFNIGTNFNAAGTVAGEVYHADIEIYTNPDVGEITIPVTMTIAGDPFPTIDDFAAELTDPVTGEVTLTWSAARATLDYYMIYRDGAPLTTVDGNTTTYMDMLPAFGSYEYELQPIFLEGDGALVGPVEVEWFEPALCWDPAAPENTQWVETQQEVMLEVENCGNGVLEYSFPDYAVRAILSDPDIEKNDVSLPAGYVVSRSEEKGDESMNGKGNPVILGAGGPDGYGYTWIDSDEAGGPVYNFIDISGTGTAVTGLGDDNTVGPYPIGFSFPFYGAMKTEFYIASNGCILFEDLGYFGLGNTPIPSSTGYSTDEYIAWFWNDMDPDNPNTHVYYEDFGNYLIIQFDTYYEWPDGGNYLNAQMIMYDDGGIMINYDYIDPGLTINSSTIGIQSTSTLGLQVAYNTAYVHDDLALYISPPRTSANTFYC